MWKYSVSEWVLNEPTTERAIECAAAAGLDAIELTASASFDPAAARRLVDALGLQVSGISPGVSADRDFAAASATQRRAAIAHLRHCIEMAQELSASIVVVVPSDRTKSASPGERGEAIERAAEAIREAVRDLGEGGPRVALEPLNRYETYLVHTLADADDLRRRIDHPCVGLMADTFHMNIEEDNVQRVLDQYGKHLVHIDLADNQRREPGSGDFDFKAFLSHLAAVGYEGWLNLECMPADRRAIQEGRRHVEAFAASYCVEHR